MPEQLVAMTAPLELTAGAPGSNTPPTFSIVAYTGQPMKLEGWRLPVIVVLAGIQAANERLPIRYAHSGDRADGVGHTTRVAVENGVLRAAGVVSRSTDAAREIVESARKGFPWQASIGAAMLEADTLKEGQLATVNGRSVAGPLIVVRAARLQEISVVDMGADGATSVKIAADGKFTATDARIHGEGDHDAAWVQMRCERMRTLRDLRDKALAVVEGDEPAADDIHAILDAAEESDEPLAIVESNVMAYLRLVCREPQVIPLIVLPERKVEIINGVTFWR